MIKSGGIPGGDRMTGVTPFRRHNVIGWFTGSLLTIMTTGASSYNGRMIHSPDLREGTRGVTKLAIVIRFNMIKRLGNRRNKTSLDMAGGTLLGSSFKRTAAVTTFAGKSVVCSR